MTSVSDMILAQFAGNFEIKAIAAAPSAPSPTAADHETKPAPEAPATQAVTELNGLAIVWMLIKDFFAGLFGRKS